MQTAGKTMTLDDLLHQFACNRQLAAIERSLVETDPFEAARQYQRVASIIPEKMAALDPLLQSAPAAPAVIVAARRYVIARDFGEYDPGKADMLWKLSN